jgi:hypothetical protein
MTKEYEVCDEGHATGHITIGERRIPVRELGAPCGGSRCWRANDGTWVHSSKSYGTCVQIEIGLVVPEDDRDR